MLPPVNRSPATLLLAVLSLTCALPAAEYGSFTRIREVIENWTPDRHLWSSGNPGVSPERLEELEGWLDANAPNWTVVLMQSANSQTHDGRSGMEAVEFALGEGLSNETAFGRLVDSRTGETNGAVFVLFLEERKFSYFASDVHDRRSLGEHHWVGRLDAPAIQAMRSGGRVVDAVKNTITSIDGALTRKLEEEAEQKRLAEFERQRAIAEARTYPGRLEAGIRESESRLAAFSAAHPEVTGAVASPDLAKWRAAVPLMEVLVSGLDVAEARREFLAVSNAIEEFHRALDQWENDRPRFDGIGVEIASHPSPEGARLVAGRLALASDALEAARKNHATGDPIYADQLVEAEGALADATRHLAEWRLAEAKRRTLTKALIAVAILSLLVVLLVANRLRRPAKTEAEALFRNWKEQLRGRFDELFQLMDRAGLVVGSSRDLDDRGYAGTTEQLAREAIRTVDELFIMSTATDRVMEEAGRLIAPRSPFGQIQNAFSPGRYRRGIRLLGGEPIGFDDRDGLASILDGSDPAARERKERKPRSLLGRIEDYEPFKLSFAQLIEAYDARQKLAKGHIDRLAAGIDGLPRNQQSLLAKAGSLSDRADRLSLFANEDRLFPLETLRTVLLPEVERGLMLASDLGKTDPVASFETLLPVSERHVAEAGILLDRIARFREEELPRIIESRRLLRELGRSTAWMEEGLSALVQRSERIAADAVGAGVADPLAAFDDDLTRFTGRGLACIELTRRAREDLSRRMDALHGSLADARGDLSAKLGLAPGRILVEPGLSPAEKLETARCGIEVALSAIDRGEAGAALEDLDEAERCLDDAGEFIRLSVDSAEDHREISEALTNEHREIESALPPAAEKLREMQDHYAPSVLLFSAPYGDEVEGPQSVVECVDRAGRLLASAAERLGESAEAFAAGSLIRARGLLETAADELGFARHQVALVEDHHAALKTAEAAIAPSLEKNRSRHRDLAVLMADPRTCRSTLTEHLSTGGQIEALGEEHERGGGDPFVRLRRSTAAGEALNAVDDGVRADWKAHALAESAATGARAALAFCQSHLHEAEHDGITDSGALSGAIRRHGELAGELDRIAVALEEAHGEWPDWYDRINALTGEISEVKATLESELAAARDAVAEINAASNAIAEVHRWRSRYSVAINRQAGAGGLVAAKERLANGLYAKARELAIAAKGVALHEIQEAQAAESAKARAAAAAASAAAARRQSFSSSSSSSFRSSSSSRSSSGFSRSGGSSGSGFSRSGW